MKKKEQWKKLIDNQIEKNLFVNIFSENVNLTFDEPLVEFIKTIKLDKEETEKLVKYCVANLLLSLYKYNQFINVSNQSALILEEIYEKLIEDIKKQSVKIDQIERKHYQKIRDFLLETNPFLMNINKNEIKTFVNEQYSYKFQLDLFNINICTLKGPILDIGCGQEHNLVTYLNEHNIEAYGIDRYDSSKPYIIKDDFLTYKYKENSWSLIISNMAFSNHFNKHLLFKDDKINDFSVAYFSILKSLKIGGKFVYAPATFEVEKLLDGLFYEVSYKEVAYNLFVTSIKRLR